MVVDGEPVAAIASSAGGVMAASSSFNGREYVRKGLRQATAGPSMQARISCWCCATTLTAATASNCRSHSDASQKRMGIFGQALHHGRWGVQRRVSLATHLREVAEIGLPLRVGMAELHHAYGLVVGEHPLDLQAGKEQSLVGAGALLHDAGDTGKVIGPQAEGLGAPAEPPLPHREGLGAVKGDDERTAGGPGL